MANARRLAAAPDPALSLPGWVYHDPAHSGMGSRLWTPGPLGESELCPRSFARKLRRAIAQATLRQPPPCGWSQERRR